MHPVFRSAHPFPVEVETGERAPWIEPRGNRPGNQGPHDSWGAWMEPAQQAGWSKRIAIPDLLIIYIESAPRQGYSWLNRRPNRGGTGGVHFRTMASQTARADISGAIDWNGQHPKTSGSGAASL